MNFLCRSPVAVVRSSCGGVAIRYVLPVLWMTSPLAVMGHMATSGVAIPGRSLMSMNVLFRYALTLSLQWTTWFSYTSWLVSFLIFLCRFTVFVFTVFYLLYCNSLTPGTGLFSRTFEPFPDSLGWSVLISFSLIVTRQFRLCIVVSHRIAHTVNGT